MDGNGNCNVNLEQSLVKFTVFYCKPYHPSVEGVVQLSSHICTSKVDSSSSNGHKCMAIEESELPGLYRDEKWLLAGLFGISLPFIFGPYIWLVMRVFLYR